MFLLTIFKNKKISCSPIILIPIKNNVANELSFINYFGVYLKIKWFLRCFIRVIFIFLFTFMAIHVHCSPMCTKMKALYCLNK